MTIPSAAFEAAGFKVGDRLQVEVLGPGRVTLSNMDSLLDEFCGCINSGGRLREIVEELKDEWE